MTKTRTTISLPTDLLAGVDDAVSSGLAASRSAFLATAVQRELDRIRQEALDREFESMAVDPVYRNEAQKIATEYQLADWEALRVAEGDS